MAINPNRFLRKGFLDNEELKSVSFVNLEHYFRGSEVDFIGSFNDPEVGPENLEKFKESEIGKAQISMLEKDLGGMKLSSDQIDYMLKQAQRLQVVGFLRPSHMAMIDPSTGVLSLAEIEYSEPEIVPETQEQALTRGIVDAVNEELTDSVNIYDREIERSINDIATKLAESLALSGVDVDPEAFAAAVAAGMKDYTEDSIIFMADKMRETDVSSLATYFGDCSPEHVIRVISQGPEWLLADIKHLYENPEEGGLEDIGPHVGNNEGNDDLDGLRQSARETLDSLEESGFLDLLDPETADNVVEQAYEELEKASIAQIFNDFKSGGETVTDKFSLGLKDIGGNSEVPEVSGLRIEESKPGFDNDM